MAPRGVTIVENRSPTRNHRLYTVNFFGTNITVTVTCSPKSVRKWLSTTLFLRRQQRFSKRLVVGMGVQWTPFTRDPDPPADTLQLCVGTRCLIFQLSHSDRVPRLLHRFLSDVDITFVGIWNSQDEKKLWESEHRLDVHRALDLRKYAEGRDGESLHRASFETIVEQCLGYSGVGLDKDLSRSDWDDQHLSDQQVLQACVDAHVSFEIGKNLRAWEF